MSANSTEISGVEPVIVVVNTGVSAAPDISSFDVELFNGTGAVQSIAFTSEPNWLLIKDVDAATAMVSFGSNVSSGATKGKLIGGASGNTPQITDADSVTAMGGKSMTLGDGSGTLKVNTTGTSNMVAYAFSGGVAYGLSVVEYTGNGAQNIVAHGLGETPELVICEKVIDSAGTADVGVYHADMDAAPINGRLRFNKDDAYGAAAGVFWSAIDVTNFTLESHADANENTQTFRMITAVSIPGLVSIGGYTGTFGASVNQITCGFQPRLFICKKTGVGPWFYLDSERGGTKAIRIDELNDYVEATIVGLTFNATGVELSQTDNVINAAVDYVYMAFK